MTKDRGKSIRNTNRTDFSFYLIYWLYRVLLAITFFHLHFASFPLFLDLVPDKKTFVAVSIDILNTFWDIRVSNWCKICFFYFLFLATPKICKVLEWTQKANRIRPSKMLPVDRICGFVIESTLILIADLINFQLFQSFCILLIVSIVFFKF